MKKPKKILLTIAAVVLVVIIIGAVVIGVSLDKIAKAAVETVAPRITQTSVTLDSVSISVLTGSAGVKNLVVGNPEGYKSPQAISVGKAAVSLSPLSVLSDKIVIHSVVVESPEITFEGNPFGQNNLNKIMDNVNGAASSGATTTTTTSTGEKKPAKKLEVDDFLLTGAKVHVQLTGIVNRQFDVPLPPVHLTDLGKGSGGITAADLTQRVLSEITSTTIKTVADSVKNLGSAAAGGAGGEFNKLKSGVGGLFGK